MTSRAFLKEKPNVIDLHKTIDSIYLEFYLTSYSISCKLTFMSKPIKKPTLVDCSVGLQVKLARRAANMSQSDLATHLSLTFQQVQKYEKGVNRISAGHLYQIANALERPISYFFQEVSLDEEIEINREEAPDYAECLELLRALKGSPRLPIIAEFLRMATLAKKK